MSSNEKNIPKRRFKEFQKGEAWEERKLGDVIDYIVDNRGKNPNNYFNEGIPVIDNYMIKNTLYPDLTSANRFIDEKIFNEFIRKYNEIDDILITLVGNGIGNITLFPKDKAVIIQNTLGLRTYQDKKFLFFLLMSKNRDIIDLDRGMAQPSIRQDEILNIDICIPKRDEQEKIGECFTKLDNLITLHQRKLDKLKVLKKAYLAQMFPSVGESKPRLRFSGFNDNWEECKLGDIGEFKNGMNFSKEAMGHGYPFVNLQDIFGQNIVNDTNLGFAESTDVQRKEYSLEKGDLLFIRSSVKPEGVGEVAVVPKTFENTTYSGFIIRFRPYNKMSIFFNAVVYSTSTIRNQIIMGATSSANTNINQDTLQKIRILIPDIKEQEQIGCFFNNIDNLITLHQRKLEKLQNIKKAYLSEMFV